MRLRVITVLETADGDPLWGYSHDEIVLPEGEEESDAINLALSTSQKFLDEIDHAKESVGRQIAATHRALGSAGD